MRYKVKVKFEAAREVEVEAESGQQAMNLAATKVAGELNQVGQAIVVVGATWHQPDTNKFGGF